ncbi:ATP-binding protein [Cereibacter sphaeroides]|uniref:ATP-binding protein n=1 Tax=Cereibacter sphaeroides TaxID=1063 RepID=UPI003990D1E4
MNACVQHFHFEPGTLIAYDGYEVVVTGSVRGGLAVRDRWIGADESVRHYVLSDAKVQELLLRPDVVIDAAFSVDSPGDLPVVSTETAFADCPAEQRRTALQKEAFCLAARTVLKGGPYHPSRIEEHLAEIIRLALDRQRLNGLGQQRNGRFEGRTWGPRSISNFCKAYFGMRQPHPRALLDRISAGNRTPRLTPTQDALLDECCHAWLSTAQPSGASIVRLVERRFRAARADRVQNGDTSPFPVPHPNTIYRRLNRFSRLEVVAGREGFRAAQKEFSPTQHGVRALKPGELIELDFWKGDVFTFSEQSKSWDLLTPDLQKLLKDGKPVGRKKERQRLWICIAIDVATRIVLGVGIAEKPNERTVVEVLDMVMRDKSDISRLAGCKMPMSQHCGLGTVIFDTGNEFFNEVVQAAILAAGGSFIYGRAAVPLRRFAADPRPLECGLDRRFVQLALNGETTWKALGLELLKQLGFEVSARRTEHEIWSRVRTQLKGQGIWLIHIDECQHMFQTLGDKEVRKVLNALKTFMKHRDWPMVLILSGIPELLKKVNINRQFQRLMTPVHMAPIDPAAPISTRSTPPSAGSPAPSVSTFPGCGTRTPICA